MVEPTLGSRIEIRRLDLGYTQARLAREVEVTRPFISMLESGQRQASLPVLRRISRVLGIPLAELIHGPGAPEPEPAPVDGGGRLREEITGRHMQFIHDIPDLLIAAGTIGLLSAPSGEEDFALGRLAFVRWTDGHEQLVRLFTEDGRRFFRRLDNTDVVVWGDHKVTSVVTELRRTV